MKLTLSFDNGERPLVKYPQKRPMIGLTERPPQLETPFSVFNAGAITPNNAFFVRYHLADVPYNIDPDTFTLEGRRAIELRGHSVPLCDIADLVGASASPLPERSPAIVVSAGGRRVAAACAGLLGEE